MKERKGKELKDMTEGMPPTPEQQMRQLNRSLMEKMLDKAASDPLWKEQLLDDPPAAMLEANFPELERLEELLQRQAALQEEAAEVTGQAGPLETAFTYRCWFMMTNW